MHLWAWHETDVLYCFLFFFPQEHFTALFLTPPPFPIQSQAHMEWNKEAANEQSSAVNKLRDFLPACQFLSIIHVALLFKCVSCFLQASPTLSISLEFSFQNAHNRYSSFYCMISSVLTVRGLVPSHSTHNNYPLLLVYPQTKTNDSFRKRALSPGGRGVRAFIMNKSFCTWWPWWIMRFWPDMTCSPFK